MDIPWQEILTGVVTLIGLLIALANKRLKRILTETRTNGGSTIKDQLDRIENSVKNLSLWVEASQQLTSKPMFKADNEGKFIWTNVAFARMLGAGIEDVKGMGWVDFVHHDDVNRVLEEWGESIRSHRKFESVFAIQNNFNSDVRKVKARAYPVVDGNNPIGYIGSWIIIEEILDVD